jgi:hypothetical protein
VQAETAPTVAETTPAVQDVPPVVETPALWLPEPVAVAETPPVVVAEPAPAVQYAPVTPAAERRPAQPAPPETQKLGSTTTQMVAGAIAAAFVAIILVLTYLLTTR